MFSFDHSVGLRLLAGTKEEAGGKRERTFEEEMLCSMKLVSEAVD